VIRETGLIKKTPLTRKTPLRQRKPISRSTTTNGKYTVTRFDRPPGGPAKRDLIAEVEREFESEAVDRPKPPPKPKRRRGGKDIPPSARSSVQLRSHGRCEAGFDRCGGRAAEMHHRKLRRFGDHSPINLLHLCRHCHNEIHRHVAWSYDHGFLVRQSDDPAFIPVLSGSPQLPYPRVGDEARGQPLTA